MATTPPSGRATRPSSAVIEWLLDADPAIRWQTLRDFTDAPETEVAAARARAPAEGWGARLLALQGADGSWSGVAWNQRTIRT